MLTNSGNGSSRLHSVRQGKLFGTDVIHNLQWYVYSARPAGFVTYMVRFNNSGKALLSTNVSNTKSRIYFLFIYVPVYPSLYASLSSCPACHPSATPPSKSVREKAKKSNCLGRKILKLPPLWRRGVFLVNYNELLYEFLFYSCYDHRLPVIYVQTLRNSVRTIVNCKG